MEILNKNLNSWKLIANLLFQLSTEQLEHFNIFYKQFEITKDPIDRIRINQCSLCNSKNVIKFGNKNHSQRYKCKDCEKIFSKTTRSIFANMHTNNFRKFIMYLNDLLQMNSLKISAQKCIISLVTSFRWRHRIMAYLKDQEIDFVKLSGLVEMDSTYFNKSFKVQKFYLKDYLVDYSYGIYKEKGASKQKLCVTCAIDRKKHIFCKYTLNGKVSIHKLNETYKDKLDLAKINAVIIDGENSYKAFLHQLNIPTNFN